MKFPWTALLMLLVAPVAWSQSAQGGHERCTVRVDVVYTTGGHAPALLRVELIKGMNGGPVAVSSTNSSGIVEFSDLAPGQYHVLISGDGIETTDSGTFEISDWNAFVSQTVAIRTLAKVRNGPPGQPSASVISAPDLNIPPKAAKEYDRGNEEMSHQKWAKAIEQFNKAIGIYPGFSAAYNNLAVCYGQMGQRDEERKVLQKAIGMNDHCLSCFLNLGQLELREARLNEAGAALDKAFAIEPDNVEALSYLAQLNFAQGQYDLAVAAARKAHTLPHKNFAVVHFTAASAFERQGRFGVANLLAGSSPESAGRYGAQGDRRHAEQTSLIL
jgi:Flp pilus assembly protein TadD